VISSTIGGGRSESLSTVVIRIVRHFEAVIAAFNQKQSAYFDVANNPLLPPIL
jgi:hypothetical protein